MNINNKFNIGDNVFSISRQMVSDVCPVCNGDKNIIVKNSRSETEMVCMNCHGRGFLGTGEKQYVVDSEKSNVSSFKVSVSTGKVAIKYTLRKKEGNKISRAESNIFKDLESAKIRCKELNYIESIPSNLNANIKEIKNIVDVFISNDCVLKNIYKDRHLTTKEDITQYIEEKKNICIEVNDTVSFYSNDFIKMKELNNLLNEKFPNKRVLFKV